MARNAGVDSEKIPSYHPEIKTDQQQKMMHDSTKCMQKSYSHEGLQCPNPPSHTMTSLSCDPRNNAHKDQRYVIYTSDTRTSAGLKSGRAGIRQQAQKHEQVLRKHAQEKYSSGKA
jgi:hypothetical protein